MKINKTTFWRAFTAIFSAITTFVLVGLYVSKRPHEAIENPADQDNKLVLLLGATGVVLCLGWQLGGYIRMRYLLWKYPCEGGLEDPEDDTYPLWPF